VRDGVAASAGPPPFLPSAGALLLTPYAFTNALTARGDASDSLRFEMYDSGAALVARLRAAASVAHIRLTPGKPWNAAVTANPTTWKG